MTISEEQDQEWLWDAGRYEDTAADLQPYAEHVVRRAAPRPGEHALDIGTGTGNAALLCAAAGARTTGLDLAQRLLGVGRERARESGVDVTWLVGDAQAIPLLDGDVDLAVSVSALVLVPDPPRSAAELVRVLRPGGGRAVIGGWDWEQQPMFPREAMAAMRKVFGEAGFGELVDEDPGWFGEDPVRRLFADLPVDVEVERSDVRLMRSGSPRELAERFLSDHPVVVAARDRLGEDEWTSVREGLVEHLAEVSVTEDGQTSMRQTALVVSLRRH